MSWIEWLAALLNLSYVLLIARGKGLGWPLGVVGALISIAVYWPAKLYLDAVLYGIYALLCAYGWWYWYKRQRRSLASTMGTTNEEINRPEPQLTPILLPKRQLFMWLLIAGLFSGLLGSLMVRISDSDVPHIDAWTTVYSLVGTVWQARMVLQNWSLWWMINAVYIGLYAYKGLPVFAALSLIYILLAIDGHRQWTQTHRTLSNASAS